MKVEISKRIDLRDGEELQGFVAAVIEAVDRAPAPEGIERQAEGEPPRIMLRGIYADHVICKVLGGGFYRAAFKRDKSSGAVKLAPWTAVKMAWVPMDAATKAEGGEVSELVKAELGELVAVQLAEATEGLEVHPDAGLFTAVIEGRQGLD